MDEKLEKQHLYQYMSEFDFCGCGDPQASYDVIQQTLQLASEKTRDYYSFAELLHGEGIAQIILGMLDAKGMISHSTNIMWASITRKGEHVLKLLYKYTEEDACNEGYPGHYDSQASKWVEHVCTEECLNDKE